MNHRTNIGFGTTSTLRRSAVWAAGLVLVAASASLADHKGNHGGGGGGGGGGVDVFFDVVGNGAVAFSGTSNAESSSKLDSVDRLIVRGDGGVGVDLTFLTVHPDTSACFLDAGPCTPDGGPSGGCTTIIDSTDGTTVTVTVPINGLLQGGSVLRDYTLTMTGTLSEPGNWLPGVHSSFDSDVDLQMNGWSVEAVSRKDRKSDCEGADDFDPFNDYFTVTRLP